MRNKILSVLLCVLFVGAGSVSAQVRFGVKAGFNLTDLSFDKKGYYLVGNKQGYHIGLSAMYALPVKGLALDASAMFDKRIAWAEADGLAGGPIYQTTIKRQQIVVPLNVRYDLELLKGLGVFAFAGPQMGINVGGSKSINMDYGDWEPKSIGFGVNLGAGVMIARHLQLSFNYNAALSKDADISINRQWGEGRIVNNAKMNAWQLSIGLWY